MNAAPYISGTHATEDKALTYADLFVTENLVFAAGTAQTNIVLDATVDLGIGYAHFGLDGTIDNPLTSARYDISAKGDYQFNHAGYVIDRGVDVYTTLNGHQTLENGDSYMFEWRKTGAGNLHIEGSGDNDIFLNVGGEGKTYLNRENGYAAYNVLANTHTTVVITDANQIYRDFTFGHQGGVLDMNGDSMEWNNDNDGAADGFTIHAQDDQAIVANLKSDSTTTLTWTQGGAQTFLGSFADNGKDSALKFVYNGGKDASLTLHSIKTHLTHANSGMEVQSGTVTLVGTNTVHGKGSLTGTNANRYHSDLDWHYADATANVTVTGGTFELGSHARLTGNVTVQNGGTFLMREGVQHAQEYIEGSTVLMNTAAINKFYGLKGNVFLAAGGTMRVEYNEGVTVNNTYSGNISGEGSVVIDLGATDAMFTLAGHNTFAGSKTLEEGILVAANVTALGNVGESGWLLGANGTLQVASGLTADNALSLIDTASTGTLALTENMTGVLDMSQSHTHLFVGAEMGKTVQYGAKENTLKTTSDNTWNLGGGGGELVVNAALQNAQGTLVLGNGQGLGGIVTLTNTDNSIGAITSNAGVTLSFTETAALGNARIDLVYGSSLLGSGNSSALLNLVTDTSKGAILLDRAGNENFDLSGHSVALGSSGNVTYDGKVSVNEDGIYRFGGGSGTLTLTQALARNGVNNLEIDGQGHSGSKIVLGAVSDITGAVTVQGSAQGSGSITLGFTANDALRSASQTTIRKGGIIDLGSTTQTLTNLQVSSGGLLMGGKGSTAVFNMTGERYQYGSMLLDQAEKVGAANLVLASTDNTWNLFTIKEGTVFTRVDNALSSTGITRVESGATLNMNTWNADGFRERTMHGNVLLAGGTLAAGDGSYDIIFNGTISAEVGMTGHINGGAKWVLNSSDNNRDGGTIQFNAARLELNQGYEQYIGGTFVVGGNTMALHSNGATENMLKHFNRLNVAFGKTLNITELTWNTIWQLDELTGEGTINWDSTTTHSKTARMILSGEGEFSGTINMLRRYSDGGRTHQAFIEINGENAVSGATLNFSGTGAQSQASLAINADNVNVGGLQSNVSMSGKSGSGYAHIYAGAAPEDAASTAARAATRKATLTITGRGDYTYAGTVGTTSDTAAKSLNVTMAGTGTQSFEGGTFVVGDLTAKSGNLRVLTTGHNTFTVMGEINLHQGGTLTLSKGTDDSGLFADYTLGSGHTLNVLQGSTGSATLNANLVLGGGTLNFDGKVLSTSSPLLNLADDSKVTYADGTSSLVITLSNTSNLYVDNSSRGSSTTYQLSSEDWSGISASSITLANMPYLNAVFNASASGLSLTLTYADNSSVWAGNSTSRFWKPGTFGSTDGAVPSTGVAVFDDSASYNDVIVDKDSSGSVVNVAKMTFNSSEDYTLTADRVYDGVEVQLNASSLDQLGSGTTTLYGNVVVSGETTITNGNLVITRAGQLQGLIGGEGTLRINLTDTSADVTFNISQLGMLQVEKGTYAFRDKENTDQIGRIVVAADASLKLGANATVDADVSVGGNLTMNVATLKGSLTLTGDATITTNLLTGTSVNENEQMSYLEAAVDASGYSLTKNGYGHLVVRHADSVFKEIHVQKGNLILEQNARIDVVNVNPGYTLKLAGQLYDKLGVITMKSNANYGASQLLVDWSSGINGATILLEGHSELQVYNGGSGNNTINADLIVSTQKDVDYNDKETLYNPVIRGGNHGGNSNVAGTITSAKGVDTTLELRNNDSNLWTIKSDIANGEGSTLSLDLKSASVEMNVKLAGNNSFSGGTTVGSNVVLYTGSKNALSTGDVQLNAGGRLVLDKDLVVSNLQGNGSLTLNDMVLTIGSSADASFAGSFAGYKNENGTINKKSIGSINKIGTNTQEFTSATAKVENVSVQGGSLVFSNTAAQIVGDIEIGTKSGEGSLTMAGTYTLDSKRTLSILSTERSTLGGLTLNGGVMALLFDDSATAETVALTVTGEVQGGSMTILLNGVMPTAEGEYLLVGGNWANVGIGGISVAVNDASAQQLYAARSADATPELYSSVKTTDSGLYLVLSEEAPVVNSNIWAPTEVDSDDIWSTTSFSQYDASALGDDVIFDASAIDKTVRVTENVSVSSMSIVGGGYTFSDAGQIRTNVLEVSGAENGASTIDKIHVTDTIMVDGSELTIVQLTPVDPAAPIVLTNAAKLTIGNDANRYGSFSGQVTGDAGSQLHLYTTKVHDGYRGEDGTVQLRQGSTVQDVYIHGDLALNIIAGSQGSLGDKFTNVQDANLHMEAGSQLVVRAEEGTGITPTTGNIVLGGDLSIVTYSPLTTATSITSNFTQEADATTNLKKMDTGSITLSGSIDVDTITVEAGTLSLTGTSIAASAYSVASGTTLQFAGAADSAAAASALLNATGAGNLVLDGVSATWNYDNASDLKGNLTLRNATLTTHGFDGDVNVYKYNNTANLSSFSSVLLDNALVKYVGATTTLNNVTVSANGAEFNIRDMGTKDTDAIKFEGTTTLEGTLKLSTTGWKSQINIASMTGSGTLNVVGAGEYVRVKLASTSDYTGNITVSGSQGRLILENSAETAYGLSTTTVTLSSGGSLYMNGNGALTLNSKLVVSSGSTSVLRNDSSAESMRRTLAAVEIASGATLELQQASWNTIWNINDLSGEGNLQWASSTNHNTTSRLILSGDGSDYTGQIIVNRSFDASERRYQAYVELASDDAVKNSLITLNCTAAQNKQNAMTTLAINTANAKVGGLASDEYAHMYAGASVAQSNAGQQASTAAHTLTITGDGTQEFKGTIGTSTETKHLNLVMMGEGSQTFSGQAYVGNVSVSNGSLILSNATVDGDVTVNGGSLNFAGSYTLGAGQVLSVLTGGADSVLLGGLTLDGGVLAFDAAMLMTDAAALKVAGTVGAGTGATVTLDFSKLTGAMQTGTYMLAAGNWAGAQLSYSGTEGMTISATESGLFLTYTNDSVYTWVAGAVDGEGAADNSWSAANWDLVPDKDSGNNQPFATGKDAVFNTNATVNVTNAVSTGTVSILNGAQVNLNMTGEGSFAVDTLLVNNGLLTLGQQTNWTGIKDITITENGTLKLAWGTGLTATSLLLQGGTVELTNGGGQHHQLSAAITVDGSGTIKGSSTGNFTDVQGSITGDGVLNFGKINDNPIKVSASMTDGADGALAVNIGDANVIYSGAKRYTGGTTIGAGGVLTVNHGGKEGGMVGVVDVYGTLKLNTGDVTGWGDSANTVSAISVYEGGILNVSVTNNQTGSGIDINLQGGTMTGVAGSNFDLSYGGASKGYSSITAMAAEGATAENPTSSTISGVQISLRQRVNEIEVQDHAVLNISSVIAQKSGDFINDDPAANGDMRLTKTGLGELVLSGANTYNVDTTVAAGTLTLAQAGSLASNVTVNEGALFRLEATSAKSFGKTISGAGMVEKTGAGVLTLTTAQELTALNVQAGFVQAGAGLSIGSLTVADGAGFAYNLSSTPTVVNAATYAGDLSLSLNQVKTGTFDLFQGAVGISADTVNLSGFSSDLYSVTTNVSDAGLVSIVVGYAGLRWDTGYDETNTWVAADGAETWNAADGADAAYAETAPAKVIFEGEGETITISGNVAPESIVVSGSGYSFVADATNGGSITGDARLTVLNGGELTLSTSNSYTGATTVSGGTLELAGAVSMAAESAISLASGTTLLLNATNDAAAMTLGNAITGAGTIHKKGTHETVLRGNIDVAQIHLKDGSEQGNNTGTLSLTGDTVKATVLYAAYGTVNVGDGTDSTFMQLVRIETGDSTSSAGSATLNVLAGSTLTVTGSNNGSSYKDASIILGEWVQATNLNVLGTMLATDAKALVGDNAAYISIGNGGVLAVKGMGVADTSSGKNEKAQEIHVTLEDGATLILGSDGITTNKAFSATLGAGTVGMSAATTTITEDLTLTSTEGSTFDTTQYVFETNASDVDTDIVRGTEGGVMTLTGNITSAENVDAKLNVKGNGTLKVAGAGSVGTNVVVDADATLELSADTQDMSYGHVISGEGDVVKSGTHNLTFTQDHSFTGTTTIAGGTLILDLGVVDEHGTTHTGVYTLDGVVTGSGSIQVNTGTTLQVNSAAHTLGTAVNLQEDAMLHFHVDADYTMGGVISGAGNVIMDSANKVTFNTAHTYTGATSIATGTLELAGQGSLADLSHMWNGEEIDWAGLGESTIYINGGGTLLLNTDGDVAVYHMIQGSGLAAGDLINYSSNIHKAGASHAVLAGCVTMGQIKVAGVGNNDADAGTLSFTGLDSTVGKLYVVNGDINVGNGTSDTLVTVSQLEVGDCEAAADVALHVHQGATLAVTGSNNGTEVEGGYAGYKVHKNASLLVSEWNANTTLTVEGTVLSQNAKLTMGDAKTTINIDGGTLAVQGISDVRSSMTGTGLDLSLTNDGKLILGEGGLTTAQAANIQLGKGTVGMTEDTIIGEDVILTSAEGITFDTTKYDYASSVVERGSEGGTMTVDGNISSAADVAAKMNVVGDGTLQLNGDVSVTGGMEVEKGATVTTSAFALQSSADVDSTASATVNGSVSVSTDSSSASIAGTGEQKGTVDNSLITIAEGASLTVDSMIISDSSRLAGTAPAVAAYALRNAGGISELTLTDSTVVLGSGNASVVGDTTAQTLAALQPMSGNGQALTMDGTSNVMNITSNALSNLVLTSGSNFVVDFSQLLTVSDLRGVDFIQLDFNNVSISTTDMSMTGLLTTSTGAQFYMNAYFVGEAVADVGSIYFDVRSIPEPTSTTLSILALAALAARRRRK